MEQKPDGSVVCYAYRSAVSVTPAAGAVYPDEEAAEQGCRADWGVPLGSWKTDQAQWRARAFRTVVGCICVFGGAYLLFGWLEEHHWKAALALPAAALVWFQKLSWHRRRESWPVCMATLVIAATVGLAIFRRDVLVGPVLDILCGLAAVSLAFAAVMSGMATLGRLAEVRRSLRTGAGALRRASNG
jgi:hypothetical protein